MQMPMGMSMPMTMSMPMPMQMPIRMPIRMPMRMEKPINMPMRFKQAHEMRRIPRDFKSGERMRILNHRRPMLKEADMNQLI